jgi:UDP-N-acetylglucosamine--N-acetylmuramyl-(pentapeptide) pyrophosphoryl-undecaprenol N-acetylglucosamine transferase
MNGGLTVRLLICAGGTGGGVYPALAVLEQLKAPTLKTERRTLSLSKPDDLKLLWVGGEGGMEAELVKRQGIPFATIPAAGVHGVGPKQLPRNLSLLTRGVWASRRILKAFRPDVLFFTGGYVAVPMAVAGWRVPTLLHVPDIEPGLALKTLARLADRITVTTESSRKYFPARGDVIVTGYPVRSGLTKWNRLSAYKKMKLWEGLPVLLVFGGSKGASTINNALLSNLPTLLEKCQIIHISGELNWPTVKAAQENLPTKQANRYHAFPYLHEEMGAALAAADLVLSRAGASTLGEFPFFGLPAILVPYPHAWRYQKTNADYLAQRGAAIVIEDARLKNELLPVVSALLENPVKRGAMCAAMRNLAHPQAAAAIANQLLALAGMKG